MYFMASQSRARPHIHTAALLALLLFAFLGHFAGDAAGISYGLPGRVSTPPASPAVHASLLHGGYFLAVLASIAFLSALTLTVVEVRIISRHTALPPLTPPPIS